jgi:hypothetical protein
VRNTKPANGSADPPDLLTGISTLAQAVSSGSAKLCEALSFAFGDDDSRYLDADIINTKLQVMLTALGVALSTPSHDVN